MATTYNPVQGNDAIVFFDIGDGYKPFVCAKDFSIEVTANNVPTTTKGSGQWNSYDYQSFDYALSCSGVVAFDDTAITSFDLALQQINFLKVPWKAIFVTRDNTLLKSYKGVCLIERTSISANAGQLSLSDFSLRGSGAFTIVECEITITDVTISTALGPRTATITGTTGQSPAKFIWQLDDGFEQETASGSFSIGTVDNGEHKLIVIPVCAGDKRGNEFVKEFVIFGENPVVSCPAVTSLNASSVASTSFDINFTTVAQGTSYRAVIKNMATGAYIYRTSTSSPFHVTGLLPDTEYHVYILTVCNIESSTPSTIITVHTNP